MREKKTKISLIDFQKSLKLPIIRVFTLYFGINFTHSFLQGDNLRLNHKKKVHCNREKMIENLTEYRQIFLVQKS